MDVLSLKKEMKKTARKLCVEAISENSNIPFSVKWNIIKEVMYEMAERGVNKAVTNQFAESSDQGIAMEQALKIIDRVIFWEKWRDYLKHRFFRMRYELDRK